MSKWNAFQSAHAGMGYSSYQMSAMYHASNSSSSSGGGGSSYNSGSSYSSSSYSAPARSASAQSSWNAYQQVHAGQGLSRAQMSAAYQASKSSSSGSSSVSAVTPSSASSFAPKASSTRPSSASTSTNAWNEYRREHAGKGLSVSELSAGYQASKASGSSPAKSNTATKAAPAKTAQATSAWNEFQRKHAGEGLSKRQLSLLYKQEAQPAVSTKTSGADKSATAPRKPNAFNEFQKQYKKDHPGEKLSAAELAEIYRGEQLAKQRRAELEPKAPDAPLAERIRRQIEEMLMEIAMMQGLGGMPADERDGWSRVARQLEWEEGNYNRQDFVDAHGQAQVWPDQDLGELDACEVIESDRLELSLEDSKRIGSGACGAVYAAVVDKSIPVAVKVIDGVRAKSKKRFEREMLAMLKSSAHENVLRVLGYTVLSSGSGKQSYGIIMELMGGGDLAFTLHRDEAVSLSEDERLRLLVQVVKAVEYIHSQDITHRDIKPHNVLLSSDHKTAKLADFGLAGFKNSVLTTQQSQVTTGLSSIAVLGLTPAYAAPEVFEGKLAFDETNAWKKSDVFSLTVLLTEILTESQPWEFETPQFIMNAVSKQGKRPFKLDELTAFGSSTVATDKLRSLVRAGWHQNPAQRPSAAEMRTRLEEIVTIGKREKAKAPPKANAQAPRASSASPRGVDGW